MPRTRAKMGESGVSRLIFGIIGLAVILLPLTAYAQEKPPYWASIGAGEARMRTGPGKQFPVSWLYRRAGLPVIVVATYPNWRKVRDPDGAQGWIQANLLSEDRGGLVRGAGNAELRVAPAQGAKVVWRAEPGVVGKLSDCGKGWCKLDVQGRGGYVETGRLWGAEEPR